MDEQRSENRGGVQGLPQLQSWIARVRSAWATRNCLQLKNTQVENHWIQANNCTASRETVNHPPTSGTSRCPLSHVPLSSGFCNVLSFHVTSLLPRCFDFWKTDFSTLKYTVHIINIYYTFKSSLCFFIHCPNMPFAQFSIYLSFFTG